MDRILCHSTWEEFLSLGLTEKRYGENIDFSFDLSPCNSKPVIKNILENNVDENILFQINCGSIFDIMLQNIKPLGMGVGMESQTWKAYPEFLV